MRAGGGQAKGAAYEREVCLALSLWVSRGARTDLFTRNVMSGGRFTLSLARGEDHGVPGDVAASHPLATAFAARFLVECKAYRDLQWPQFLAGKPSAFLFKVIAECERQIAGSNRAWMIVARQNSYPSIVMTNMHVNYAMRYSEWPEGSVPWHSLHNGVFWTAPLSTITAHINCGKMLKRLNHGDIDR